MSNDSSEKSSNVPVGQPQVSSAANAGSINRGEPQAKPSAPINLNNATTLNRPSGLFDENSEPPKESTSVINTNNDGPRELAAAENISPARAQNAERTEGESDRQVNVPVPAALVAARPSPATRNPMDPTGEEFATSQREGQAKLATQAGGAVPPGLPPAVVASSPEEPKPTPRPTPSDNAPPPLLDVEEFIREAEDRKRGAKTMREIKALAEDIRVIRQRGIPVASIHAGLKKKGLVTCSRSRFDEICAELLPDLFEPKRRGNA